MAILPIVLAPSDVLRKKAKPVTKINAAVRQLLDDMVETMIDAPGIGLAAPQVGVSKRLIVVDVPVDEGEEPKPPLQLVNPEIVKAEGWCHLPGGEGCLSLPGLRGDVDRRFRIQVVALDPKGHKIYVDAEGLLAIILQHEIDHLDGVLFPDKAKKVWEVKPEEESAEGDEEAEPVAETEVATARLKGE